MIRDHRPYWLRQLMTGFEACYRRHFLDPAFETVGADCMVAKPWHVHVFGPHVTLGEHVEIRATAEDPVRFTTWPGPDGHGRIEIGACALIGPGVRLQSARSIDLQDGAMLASKVLITDADWHGLHDRVSAPGRALPVVIGENAWIGDSAIILKGSRIGRNAIVGAGAVVRGLVPDNAVALGNPAQVVRMLDPDEPVVGRRTIFEGRESGYEQSRALNEVALRGNTFAAWLRSRLFPRRGD